MQTINNKRVHDDSYTDSNPYMCCEYAEAAIARRWFVCSRSALYHSFLGLSNDIASYFLFMRGVRFNKLKYCGAQMCNDTAIFAGSYQFSQPYRYRAVELKKKTTISCGASHYDDDIRAASLIG